MQSEADTKKERKRQQVTDEELKDFINNHIIPVLREKDGSLTRGVVEKEFSDEVEEELGIKLQTFYNRIYRKGLKEETALADYENAVEVWADALEQKHGRLRFNEFKQYLDKQTVNQYSQGHHREALFNELDKREGIQYNASGTSGKNKPFTIFIKTQEDPFNVYRERLPDEEKASEIFEHLLGRGFSPKTIVAGIRYVYGDVDGVDKEDITYSMIADEEDCSGVSVSKLEDEILDEFDIEVAE